MRFLRFTSLMALAIAFAVVGTGCNRDHKAKAKVAATAHVGWWCQEHGVPEEECSICMSEASAKKMFKDKGDWCKLHDRAQSQCFKCDPSLYEKVFVPKYVAKMGKMPERPLEAEFVDETKKKG
jgi:hypothetical protein